VGRDIKQELDTLSRGKVEKHVRDSRIIIRFLFPSLPLCCLNQQYRQPQTLFEPYDVKVVIHLTYEAECDGYMLPFLLYNSKLSMDVKGKFVPVLN
jgi:hypothetical protein